MRRILLGAALGLAAAPALAAGDPAAGRALAERWCANCHVIGAGHPGGDAAPPFTAIANDPGRTPARIRGWLSTAHPRMPDFGLTPREIDDVNAYLESLARR